MGGSPARADRDGRLAGEGHTGAARAFRVHGEEDAMQAFKAKLSGTKVEMPAGGETVER